MAQGFTNRSSASNEAARSKQLDEESEEQTKSREAKLLSLNWVSSNPFTVALIAKAWGAYGDVNAYYSQTSVWEPQHVTLLLKKCSEKAKLLLHYISF